MKKSLSLQWKEALFVSWEAFVRLERISLKTLLVPSERGRVPNERQVDNRFLCPTKLRLLLLKGLERLVLYRNNSNCGIVIKPRVILISPSSCNWFSMWETFKRLWWSSCPSVSIFIFNTFLPACVMQRRRRKAKNCWRISVGFCLHGVRPCRCACMERILRKFKRQMR